MKQWTKVFLIITFLGSAICFSGCDFIYRLLQKEGAEEKAILKNIPPFQYNPIVEDIQTVLIDYGYNPGIADGKFGPKTREALATFQEDQGLKVSNFLDKETWQRIQDFKKAGLIRDGHVNMAVVQKALHKAGYDPGIIDGKMGPKTAEALKLFQKEHGLKPDGIIGKRTIRILMKYLIPYKK